MSNATKSQNLVFVGLQEHVQNDSGQIPVPARHRLLIPILRRAEWDKAALFNPGGEKIAHEKKI